MQLWCRHQKMSFLDEKNARLLVDLLLVVAVVGLLVGAALRFAGRTDLEGIFIQMPVFFKINIHIWDFGFFGT